MWVSIKQIKAELKSGERAIGAFHAANYRAAHNRFLVKSSDALAEALALLGPTTLSAEGRAHQSIDEHAEIVAAIRQRDAHAADHAARQHIRNAFKTRLMQLDQRAIDEQLEPNPHSPGTAAPGRPRPPTP